MTICTKTINGSFKIIILRECRMMAYIVQYTIYILRVYWFIQKWKGNIVIVVITYKC